MSDLKSADEIIDDYRKPNRPIDSGNLFFAATEYQKQYKSLEIELAECVQSHDGVVTKAKQLQRLLIETKQVFDQLLKYCEPHTDQMWAAVVVSNILTCDFQDSKQKLKEYLDAEKNKI